MVRIRNFGSNPVSNIPLFCRIDSLDSACTDVFTDTVVYPGPLAPSESADVTFPKSWTGAVGNDYDVTMFTSLPEDSIYDNDTACAPVSVQPQPAAVEEQRTNSALRPTMCHQPWCATASVSTSRLPDGAW